MITTKRPLTALDTLQRELSNVLIEQMSYVDDYGIVTNRYLYQQTVVKAKLINESIAYLQSLKAERIL